MMIEGFKSFLRAPKGFWGLQKVPQGYQRSLRAPKGSLGLQKVRQSSQTVLGALCCCKRVRRAPKGFLGLPKVPEGSKQFTGLPRHRPAALATPWAPNICTFIGMGSLVEQANVLAYLNAVALPPKRNPHAHLVERHSNTIWIC